MSVDVSIIIVNWNTGDLLRGCLNSVLQLTSKISFEIIVIDNASTDRSGDIAAREFGQVILVRNSVNNGFAAANNQGIRLARGRYILCLNPDTVILSDAIGKVVAFADKHPEAAVIGCKVLNPDGTLQPTCFMYPSLLNLFLSSTYLYKIFPRSRFFGREFMGWWQRDTVEEVDVVTGCFMLVRREAIDQVGLLDERFFVYGEETDWCYRFKRAGWKILFYPDAQIIHYGGQSTKQLATEMCLQLRGSILQFIRKHKSKPEFVLACLLMWFFFSIRLPFWATHYVLSRSPDSKRISRTYLKGMWRLPYYGVDGLCAKNRAACGPSRS